MSAISITLRTEHISFLTSYIVESNEVSNFLDEALKDAVSKGSHTEARKLRLVVFGTLGSPETVKMALLVHPGFPPYLRQHSLNP